MNNETEKKAMGCERAEAAEPEVKAEAAEPETKAETAECAEDPAADASGEAIRVRKKRRRKNGALSRGQKIALGIVIAVVALLAACGIALAVAVNVGNVNLHTLASQWKGAPTEAEPAQEDEGHTIVYGGDTYRFNENVVSVLVMGLDDESGYVVDRPEAQCNDANFLVTMDTSTNDVSIIAIPRDTQVDVDLYQDGKLTVTKLLQLCLAYSTDSGSARKCALNACASVSRIFYGLPINYYITIDQRALEDASTAVGGVPVKALETIPGTPIVKGQDMLLEGNNAWMYLHYRDCNVDGSAQDRLARQKQFLEALVAKLRTVGASGVLDVYNSVSDKMDTNIGASEVTYLASCLVSGDSASTEFITLKGKTKILTDDDGIEREHVFLKRESIMDAITSVFYTKAE